MGKWRGLFFLFAFFMGMLFGGEDFFQPFSLRNIRIESEDPVAELFFWKNISSRALRFWPAFFLEKDDLRKAVEIQAPLFCTISRRGITGVEVQIEPLRPWIVAQWNKREYYVSQDGFAWDTANELNKMIRGIVRPNAPLITFSDDFPSPALENSSAIVSRVVFPLELLQGWLDGLAENRWGARVEQISVSRREGKFLLKLVFYKGGAHVLLWGDRPRWKELSSALSQIMEQLHFLGNNIIIDTTYTDRIIVRSMARGDQEGSGR